MTAFSSFELLFMKFMQPTQLLFIATVYSAPGPYTAFLTEFPEFLLDLVVMANNIHIFGDFNIHMEKSTDPLQKAFGASGFCPTCFRTYSLPQLYSGPSFVPWNKYCGS